MKTKCLITVLVVFSFFQVVKGQQEEPFKPSGKVEVRIFSNFTSTFSDTKNFNKFDVTRAYFGYIHDFSRNFRGRITYDVGNPGAGKNHYSGFLKFAYLQYHTPQFSLIGGMIPGYQYPLVDAKWGYRYIINPLHTEYGFGTAADIGIGAEYKPASWISGDLVLTNGEGFKTAEGDSTFKMAAGVSIFPVKKLMIRGYFDSMKKDNANQQTAEVLAVFENKRVRLSAAYSFQKDHALVRGNDFSGYTFNGTLFLNSKFSCLARYDYVESEIKPGFSNPWNIAKDGQFFMAGLEFIAVKGVCISPNFQLWNPAQSGKPSISRISLNVDIKI